VCWAGDFTSHSPKASEGTELARALGEMPPKATNQDSVVKSERSELFATEARLGPPEPRGDRIRRAV
jgi:hypothetical protein